jgi:WD40 repeat protein
VRNFPDVDHSVLSLSFSPDNQWLAAGGAATGVDLWYTESASIAATLQGHDGYVHGVAFSPDGTTLASASRDHTIKIWKTR